MNVKILLYFGRQISLIFLAISATCIADLDTNRRILADGEFNSSKMLNTMSSIEEVETEAILAKFKLENLASSLHENWSDFVEKVNQDKAEFNSLCENIRIFIANGGFALDSYEAKMRVLEENLNQRLGSEVKVLLHSSRSEDVVLKTIAKGNTLAPYFERIRKLQRNSKLVNAYAVAMHNASDKHGSVAFFEKSIVDLANSNFEVSPSGVVIANDTLSEQAIMQAITTEDIILHSRNITERYLAEKIHHFFVMQHVFANFYPSDSNYKSVLEFAGRRLPLVVALLSQTLWLQFLDFNEGRVNSLLPQSTQKFVVSSLALTAFINCYYQEKPFPGSDRAVNSGTIGHKFIALIDAVLRQKVGMSESLEDFNLVHYSQEEKVQLASLAAEIIAHAFYNQNFGGSGKNLILPDLYGIKMGLDIWNKFQASAFSGSSLKLPYTLRIDSSRKKAVGRLKTYLKNPDEHFHQIPFAAAVFSEVDHDNMPSIKNEMLELASISNKFYSLLGIGGAFYGPLLQDPNQKISGNAVKIVRAKLSQLPSTKRSRFHSPSLELDECFKITDDGKVARDFERDVDRKTLIEEVEDFRMQKALILDTLSAEEFTKIVVEVAKIGGFGDLFLDQVPSVDPRDADSYHPPLLIHASAKSNESIKKAQLKHEHADS